MHNITEAEGKKAFEVHNAILNLKKQMGMAFVEIGKLLKEVRDNKLYRVLGYDTFQSYIVNSELGFKTRTVYYYIEIYECFIQELKVEMEKLADLGFDKLVMLLPMVEKLGGSERVICDKIENLMHEATELRPHDFKKKYNDEKKQENFSNYLAPPEYVRCDKCGKWKIILPVNDCCIDWIKEFSCLIKKLLDKSKTLN